VTSLNLTEPVDLDRLRRSFDDLTRWSAPSRYEGSSALHHGYQTCLLWHGGFYTPDGDRLAWLLEQFQPLVYARATRLLPGGWIDRHVDMGDNMERWQIPVSPSGTFHIDEIPVEQIPGRPFLVAFDQPHWLDVPADAPPRTTLVVDRTLV
jgi:hypothetical protein